MPPKRPPRRGKSYGMPGAPALAEVALKDLRRAHTLMERGEHANAAVLFERQARDAGDRGLALPAAHLYLQAGRARLLAGEIEAGEGHIRAGLEILSSSGDLDRLAKSGSLLAKDLARMGQAQVAGEVAAFMEQALKDNRQDGAVPKTAALPLPLKCPKCGANLRLEDIESGDGKSPICVYCGSLIDP